jgi:phage head maturation protease
METKSLQRTEIKDADKGTIALVFAKYNEVDHDGDVTLPGAFDDGAKARISAYNHTSWGGALPVGDGSIKVIGDEAQFHGQFYMDTQHGADTFKTVKRQSEAGLQEWSYGYDTVKMSFGEFGEPPERVRFLEKQRVHEVSPVLLGAGIGTRTLSAKGADAQTFTGEAAAVVAVVSSLVDRAADVLAMRREKGKTFGSESAELLRQVDAQLKQLTTRLGELLTEPERSEVDEAAKAIEDAEREYLRFLALAHNL